MTKEFLKTIVITAVIIIIICELTHYKYMLPLALVGAVVAAIVSRRLEARHGR